MKAKVYGIYDASGSPAAIAQKQANIIRSCTEANLPAPTFAFPDYLEATVYACEETVRVWLVGSLSDVRAPADPGQRGFSDEEWREGWLEYLAEESLAWLSVDQPASLATESLSRVSVVRSYRRAWIMLMEVLAKARSRRSKSARSAEPKYTIGRPPYGYRAKDGCLVHDSPQVLARVRKVYELIRARVPVSTVATTMEEQEGSRPDGVTAKGKKRWWDNVKIRRLLAHAPLYCLGEYRRGKTVTKAPELAFLPADWVGTVPYRRALPGQPAGPEDLKKPARKPFHPPLKTPAMLAADLRAEKLARKARSVAARAAQVVRNRAGTVSSRPGSGKLRASAPPST